jgi:four helix bundle protein
VAANYRAVCRARSKAEFIARIGIAAEEADEAVLWLELLTEAGIIKPEMTEALLKEARELAAILTASQKTAKRTAVTVFQLPNYKLSQLLNHSNA